MNHVSFGRDGEKRAVCFLNAQGYRIIEQNYRQSFGEIDIIAKDGKTLCFIEVKTRETDDYGHPFEAVTRPKQKVIRKVAQMYLIEHDIVDEFVRFDVVGVHFDENGEESIELLKDAF